MKNNSFILLKNYKNLVNYNKKMNKKLLKKIYN